MFKKLKYSLFLVALIAVIVAFSNSTEWKIANIKEVKIDFQLVNDGTKGNFSSIETKINFDKNDLKNASIQAIVDVKSISTNNKGRDEHLLNADFFDSEKYPTIVFESKEISKTEEGFIAKGTLKMKDQTLPIDVSFQFVEKEKQLASFVGKMQVSPYKFGVVKSKKGESELVNVTVELPLSN